MGILLAEEQRWYSKRGDDGLGGGGELGSVRAGMGGAKRMAVEWMCPSLEKGLQADEWRRAMEMTAL
jgi:hypothetical protein